MKLLLTVKDRGAGSSDVLLPKDASAPVGDAARALDPKQAHSDAMTLRLLRNGQWEEIVPALMLIESPIGSGPTVEVGPVRQARQGSGSSVRILSGPEAGRTVVLRRGVNTVGRDRSRGVILSDPLVSKHHAVILVQDEIEMVDDHSVNGVIFGGELVQRASLRPGDQVILGESTIPLEQEVRTQVSPSLPARTQAFNCSPRVVPSYPGEEFEAPEPPTPTKPQPVPWAAAVPILLGAVIYLITKRWESVLRVTLSPLMVLGSYFQNRAIADEFTFVYEVES